jgi:acetyltransferase-like isoleucine patch superfamily enzyme
MNQLLEPLRTWLFLRKMGIEAGTRIVLEGRKKIYIGPGTTLGDEVKIRSRSDEARISIGAHTRCRGHVHINAKGDPVTIGPHCFLADGVWIGGYGSVTIGANTIIGIRSIIISSDHDYMNLGIPYYDIAEIRKPIVIGDNVWIGCNSVILAGSTIGSGSVIGAGSIIRGDIPHGSLVVGRAAEVLRHIER